MKRREQNSNELLSAMNADKYYLETRETFAQRKLMFKNCRHSSLKKSLTERSKKDSEMEKKLFHSIKIYKRG